MSRGRPRIEDQRPEVADIVGILPDRQAAKLLGVSRSTVAACRERLACQQSRSMAYTCASMS